MSNPTHDPFYSSPFGPFYRRHSPYMVQPEYRIYEMNKRLQARTEVSSPDAFAARSGSGRGTGRRVLEGASQVQESAGGPSVKVSNIPEVEVSRCC